MHLLFANPQRHVSHFEVHFNNHRVDYGTFIGMVHWLSSMNVILSKFLDVLTTKILCLKLRNEFESTCNMTHLMFA